MGIKVESFIETDGDFTEVFVNKKNETTSVRTDVETGDKVSRKVTLEGELKEKFTPAKQK